jgi:hypothetical protein
MRNTTLSTLQSPSFVAWKLFNLRSIIYACVGEEKSVRSDHNTRISFEASNELHASLRVSLEASNCDQTPYS